MEPEPKDPEYDRLKKMIATGPCLIKFTAHWCGPCQSIREELEETCHSLGFKKIEIDVDVNKRISEYYEVTVLPTCIISSPGNNSVSVQGANMNRIREAMRKMHTVEHGITPIVVNSAIIHH